MANELVVVNSLTYAPSASGQVGFTTGTLTNTVSMTNTPNAFMTGLQTVGFATEEAIALGYIQTAGFVVITNLEATGGNFLKAGKVKVTLDGDGMGIKILPGETVVFRANGAPFVLADTAAVDIQYWVFEL